MSNTSGDRQEQKKFIPGAYLNSQGGITLCQPGKEREGFGFVSMICAVPDVVVQEVTPKPSAYMRRWAFDGEKPFKERKDNGRLAWAHKFKLLPVTQRKALTDDVPLFATAPSSNEVVTPCNYVDDWDGSEKFQRCSVCRDRRSGTEKTKCGDALAHLTKVGFSVSFNRATTPADILMEIAHYTGSCLAGDDEAADARMEKIKALLGAIPQAAAQEKK
jgi:hypothetical protein